jgi:HK97 family phage portal protein
MIGVIRLSEAVAWVKARLITQSPLRRLDVAMPAYVDQWRVVPQPTPYELVNNFKGLIYVCASLNASTLAAVPLKLYVTTSKGQASPKCATKRISAKTAKNLVTKGWASNRVSKAMEIDEVTDYPILTLLEQVNVELDGYNLMEFTALYQEMTGVAYWWLEPDGMGGVSNIWILQSQDITIQRDAAGNVVAYIYGPGKEKVVYPPEEILPFRYPNLRDPYYWGWGPAQAAWEEWMVICKENGFSQALYDNMAMPGIIISPKDGYGNMGTAEKERLEGKFNRSFRRGNNGKTFVMDEAISVNTLTIPPKDLKSIELYDSMRRIVANVFGVPISKIERTEANRASAESGDASYMHDTILPRCTRMEQRLTQKFAARWDDRLFFAYDNPVPADTQDKREERKVNLGSGYWTINEAREDEGVPSIDDPAGDMRLVPSTMIDLDHINDKPPAPAFGVPPGATPAGGPAVATPGKRPEPEVDTILDPAMQDQAAKFIKAANTPYRVKVAAQHVCEHGPTTHNAQWHKAAKISGRVLPKNDKFKGALKAIFAEQKRHLIDALAQAKVWQPPHNYDDAVRSIGADYTEEMVKRLTPYVEAGYDFGGGDFFARNGLQDTEAAGAWNVSSPGVQDAIRQATMKFCAETNATTEMELSAALDKLREDLAAGLTGHENTIPELTRIVQNTFANADQIRAERIAMTEASRAIHAGQIQAAKDSGVVVGKKWLLAPDACELCQEIAAENPDAIPLDASFKNMGDGPYDDIQGPPGHPWCLVGETPVLAPGMHTGMRVAYNGPIMRVVFAGGSVSVSPNHMFLTPTGFASAATLRKGDKILYYAGFNRVLAGSPDNHGKPTAIQEVFATLAESSRMVSRQVPPAAEYLHGDAAFANGNIHVVSANSLLRNDRHLVDTERISDKNFTARDVDSTGFQRGGNLAALLLRLRDATDGGMGVRGIAPTFFRRHAGSTNALSFGSTANGNAGQLQMPVERGPRDAETLADCEKAFSGEIVLREVLNVYSETAHYASSVYDLSTDSSLYIANGLLSSNCQCSLTEELDMSKLNEE